MNASDAAAAPRPACSQLALICGDLGAGKTTVARAMSDILSTAHIRHGNVDLDALCQLHPSEKDYRDNYALKWENLAAIWPRFVSYGATHGIASGTLHNRVDRQRLVGMLGPSVSLTVVRLNISASARTARLNARESDPEVRAWHVQRAVRASSMDRGDQMHDFEVSNESRAVDAVAHEILDRLGWVPADPKG